jgi:signal transduction histidine kinase
LAAASRFFYFAVLAVATSASKQQGVLARARIETLERAQELEHEILRTSEREQQRIGRDLHDSLGPHLAAIGYAATFLANELRQREQPEAAKAERIGELVGEAVSLTRNLARGIFPVQMDGSGLAMALKELASTVSSLAGMTVTFCETGDPLVEDPEHGMHLYRIVQEAVNNAAKHGAASNVTIILSKSGQTLRLVIADDGNGMPPALGKPQGMGLPSMKYRARALGGKIDISSSPNEGTTVCCEIPLRPLSSNPVS